MKTLLIFLTLFFSIFTLTAQNVDLKRGLVAYYPFNGNANDESGNGNHGTVNGASLTNDRNEITNSSYYFNGINDYITASFLNINSIAVSFWFRSSMQNNDYSTLVDCNKKFYCMVLGPAYKYNSGKIFYRANLEDDIYSDLIYSDNKWHHIYIDFDNDSGKQKMYINGVFIKSNSINKIGYLSKIHFGRQENHLSTTFFKGNIDDIHIYNRGLNENEIQMLLEKKPIKQKEQRNRRTFQPVGPEIGTCISGNCQNGFGTLVYPDTLTIKWKGSKVRKIKHIGNFINGRRSGEGTTYYGGTEAGVPYKVVGVFGSGKLKEGKYYDIQGSVIKEIIKQDNVTANNESKQSGSSPIISSKPSNETHKTEKVYTKQDIFDIADSYLKQGIECQTIAAPLKSLEDHLKSIPASNSYVNSLKLAEGATGDWWCEDVYYNRYKCMKNGEIKQYCGALSAVFYRVLTLKRQELEAKEKEKSRRDDLESQIVKLKITPLNRNEFTSNCLWMEDKNQYSWSGGCQNGKLSGSGRLIWYLNGELIGIFEGNMVNGRWEGEGIIQYPNGARYSGNFQNGKFHGSGNFENGAQNFFNGEYNQGSRWNGRGTVVVNTGLLSYETKIATYRNGNQTIEESSSAPPKYSWDTDDNSSGSSNSSEVKREKNYENISHPGIKEYGKWEDAPLSEDTRQYIMFEDGTSGYLFNDDDGYGYHISEGLDTNHYYKTYEATLRALYVYRKYSKIIKRDQK